MKIERASAQKKVAPNHVGHTWPPDADDPRWGWHLVHIKAKAALDGAERT